MIVEATAFAVITFGVALVLYKLARAEAEHRAAHRRVRAMVALSAHKRERSRSDVRPQAGNLFPYSPNRRAFRRFKNSPPPVSHSHGDPTAARQNVWDVLRVAQLVRSLWRTFRRLFR